ncbi:MAG: phosphoesterase PA-phosphatase [Clostridia bacterium]|nr:phosphoesterase PA-phosphatase [Clostridia bacterium]
MDKKSIKYLISTIAAFLIFLAFTLIVAFADVSEINGVKVGLSAMNAAYYKAVPFNKVLYKITSYTQFVCVFGALFFFVSGIVQWGKRKSLLKVDRNIAALGITYAVTIVFYVLFEIVAVNFRPVNLHNKAEASYPSSTTLLSIVFFSTAYFQILKYIEKLWLKITLVSVNFVLMLFLVIGRMLSGVHWLSDIFGAMLLGGAILSTYLLSFSLLTAKERVTAKM